MSGWTDKDQKLYEAALQYNDPKVKATKFDKSVLKREDKFNPTAPSLPRIHPKPKKLNYFKKTKEEQKKVDADIVEHNRVMWHRERMGILPSRPPSPTRRSRRRYYRSRSRTPETD